MRGSCSDDLEREGYPEKTIDGWIGNTARVWRKHYHGNWAEDWVRATGKAAPPTPVNGHQEPLPLHESRVKSLDVLSDAENQHPRQGSLNRCVAREKGSCLKPTSLKPRLCRSATALSGLLTGKRCPDRSRVHAVDGHDLRGRAVAAHHGDARGAGLRAGRRSCPPPRAIRRRRSEPADAGSGSLDQPTRKPANRPHT